MRNWNDMSGLSPELRAALLGDQSLPVIRGKWFVVDPYGATYTAQGGMPGQVVDDLETAYGLCTSGAGDGILVLSGGTTATHTTSKLKAAITWDKHAITVYGVAAGGYNSRARIANHGALTSAVAVAMNSTAQTITRGSGSFVTDGWEVGMKGVFDTSGTNSNVTFTVSAVSALVLTGTVGTDSILTEGSTSHTLCGYFPQLITVSGANNRFYNCYFINEASHVLNLGPVLVTGARNLFVNCHFNSVGALQSADAGLFDLQISSSECQFVRCWFGNNNVARSAANGNIVLGVSTTALGQNYFEDCYVLSTSNTAGHGAILVTNAATQGGVVVFKKCTFINWFSGAITALTTAIIGATPNNFGILLDDCSMVGWAAWGANNDKWATTNAVGAAGTGGIAGTIA
jgi:hypothetical protein